MTFRRLHRLTLAAAAVAALAGTAPAGAQDKPVELKFAHWLPAQHPLFRTGFEPWAKSVEAASKGSIKVAFFPAQQLGKAADHYDMARDGIADMTWVNPGYQAGRFPMYAAGELPFLNGKPGPASAALDAWYRTYAAKEMADVKFCFGHLHVGALHSKKPITEPEQIKGMKIRPANGTVAQMMSQLGATNVQVSAPEARDALEKGVADAITFPWKSIVSFGIDKAVKYHTDFRLYAANFVWVMNPGWYGKLSPSQKQVIDSHCTNEWASKVGTAWGDDEDSGRDTLSQQAGHTIVKLTPEQLAAWKKAVAPIYDAWTASATKAGVNGTLALEALRRELATRGGAN
jgi:TRAP-type C4-dicarboxylate transport system substrate-binding protein